jgi:hypothetical protein
MLITNSSKKYFLLKSAFYFLAVLAFGYVAINNEKNIILWTGGSAMATGSFLLFIHYISKC